MSLLNIPDLAKLTLTPPSSTSIFDIPELAALVGSRLSINDLVECVRVSKLWHVHFAPLLWHSIPPRRPLAPPPNGPNALSDFRGWNGFRQMVRGDYLLHCQQQQQKQQHLHDEEEGSDKKRRLAESSVLSRYGPKIYKITLFQCQLKGMPSRMTHSGRQGSLAALPEPTEQELLLHLLKHCPNLKSLELENWTPTGDDDGQVEHFWNEIATDIVPRLQDLAVTLHELGPLFDPRKEFRPLLAHCSAKMQTLRVSDSRRFNDSYQAWDDDDEDEEDEEEQEEEQQEEEEMEMRSRDLVVHETLDEGSEREDENGKEMELRLRTLDVRAFDLYCDWSAWSRFLKRCIRLESLMVESLNRPLTEALSGQVCLKRLYVGKVDASAVQFLTDTLETRGLPNLDDITLIFDESRSAIPVTDQDMEKMLSFCRKGWRSINISTLGPSAVEGIIDWHCSTLESLRVRETPGVRSTQLRHILRLSPNLHTFVILEDRSSRKPLTVAEFSAQDFFDLDTSSGSLKPWKSESSLKVFRAKISGIPRPDVVLTYNGYWRGTYGPEDTYADQSQEVQRRVYERLSRFERLEELGLGHDDRDLETPYFRRDKAGGQVYFDSHYQYECLEMSLESGLGMLEGLKELRDVNVFRMATRIGVDEVQWMAESWPKLRALRGLKTEKHERGADEWLRENCPWIYSNRCTFAVARF
ncbi:hypothetical protein BGX33_009317 [Mortierella sp. NVP41]|nr:hypothetical protein BGX33_009317 [Mortierella sp. NVP41]